MPIRMVKDENKGGNRNIPDIGGSGGGQGGGCLTMLLPLLLRNPKLLIPLVIIGVILYFVAPQFTGNVVSNVTNGAFSTGYEYDAAKYDRTEIFEPLADNAKNPLPAKVSLRQYAPQRLNQGEQGSCVGWSSAYAARTIMYAEQTGANPNSVRFSPSSLYNQIKLPGCQGAYIQNAMETMLKKGLLPFDEFPYDETSCSLMPDNSDYNRMAQYRTKGYNRLTLGSQNSFDVDMLAIKQNLAQGAPVVVGLMVGGSFMGDMMGKKIWRPTQSDYYMQGFGGHALCVMGYDDDLDGGCFEIMNSWGEEWGDKGIFFINYQDFQHFCKEAYGLYPMGNANEDKATELKVDFGLVNNETEQNIAFKQVSGNLFETSSPIRIGDKFKIEVTNNTACYTYIFGQETDGSSYVLFPYTEKHSPYCGITGTRVFPSDYSMQADDIGTQDFMAVVISKDVLDYNLINNAINQAQGTTYQQKVNNALSSKLMKNVDFTSGGNIHFQGALADGSTVAVVMQIDKK
ncbi:MAG: DUF4384 domain-containing protein [Chitinophagales bacterium]|nr:DUF4384 domain-containing protein [Chitinophagales bacterium]